MNFFSRSSWPRVRRCGCPHLTPGRRAAPPRCRRSGCSFRPCGSSPSWYAPPRPCARCPSWRCHWAWRPSRSRWCHRSGRSAGRCRQHTDAEHLLGAAVVGHVQPGSCWIVVQSYLARSIVASTTRQRFELIGRSPMMRAVSPTWQSSLSSCAMNFFERFTNLPYLACFTALDGDHDALVRMRRWSRCRSVSFLRFRSMSCHWALLAFSSRARSSVSTGPRPCACG